MTESTYPKSAADVLKTLTDIFRHQKRPELIELLENAHAYFDELNYDNWNGGTTTWALRLEVPTVLFANAEESLEDVEKELKAKLRFLDRFHPNDPIGEVTIGPLLSAEISLGQQLAPSEHDVRRIWWEGYFRLFLSHISVHKLQVSSLKDALFERGVCAFVAHEDIEPTREWQNEIALALRSMNGLAALITPSFHESNWTDQEIGWALGRGVPVVSVRLGADPHGFIGREQAVSGSLDTPAALADSILQALLHQNQCKTQMRQALVYAFENAVSYANAKSLRDIIVGIDDFTVEEKDRLRDACKNNDQVSRAHSVSEAIYSAFGSPVVHELSEDDVPF